MTAPACPSAPSYKDAEYDSSGRLWGWTKMHPCAYKDARGVAVPMSGFTVPDPNDPNSQVGHHANAAISVPCSVHILGIV